MRILFVGDIHLGRRPSGLPEDLGVSPAELTPAAAWRKTVTWALDNQVEAVVLAGDVVDSENQLFEAFGPLEDGVRRLVEGKVAVLSVVGNHDTEALPRLARVIPSLRILGGGGVWEEAVLRGGDGAQVALRGWSFPQPRFGGNPMEAAGWPGPREGTGTGVRPLFGILHSQMEGTPGDRGYAPVRRSDLERAGLDGWILGHVHDPSPLAMAPHIGYLGSLQGLDPTETGPRGPWLVTIQAGQPPLFRHIALAPLRWDSLELPLEGLAQADDLLPLLDRAWKGLAARLEEEPHPPLAVGVRITLTGRCPAHSLVRRAVEDIGRQGMTYSGRNTRFFLDRLRDETRPRLDLQALAQGRDLAGFLAGQLLVLEKGGPEAQSLIREARSDLARPLSHPRWSPVQSGEPSEAQVMDNLMRAGLDALEELLSQVREGRS